ncbi:hypothetical protein [Sorangium cellulosum]|uniref:hypothetical protein n=1 Tax=Sorangium TaxID=39643 RepID=UPI001F3DAA56|nr:hypothetical protein [Sorangium cellulosum]
MIRIPVVLALDCSPGFLARCRRVAARARFLVRSCDAASAWGTAVRLRPLAIILPSHLHDRAPQTFELLAEDAGARLVVVESEQLPPGELEGHITHAIGEAARARRA